MSSVAALIIGFLMDLIVGDPQWRWHPVRIVGQMIGWLEGGMNRGENRKLNGIVLVVIVASVVGILVGGLLAVSSRHGWVGIVVSGVLIYFTISVKCLADEAKKIAESIEAGNLDQARRDLGMIVGRDTQTLSETEVVRATVETVAESTMDGIISPLFFAVLCGPTGAWVYRAVNTLDSMVGHKNERYRDFGWASAKCDAFMNWVPSKVTAFLISLSFGISRYAKGAWRWTGKQLFKGPESNGETAESAMAGGLGVRLGGMNFYNGVPVRKALIGDEIEPLSVRHIYQSIRMSYVSAILMLLVSIVVAGRGGIL